MGPNADTFCEFAHLRKLSDSPPLSDSYPTIGQFCVGYSLINRIINLLEVFYYAHVSLLVQGGIEPLAS
jgi:hypothetical protein